MKITIGLPAYNEEKNIGKIISELQELNYSIIVCNDGSSDQTGKIAEKMGVVVVNHQKNTGYGSAIKSLFLKAKEINSDFLVTFDADGQHNISDISDILKPLISMDADIVIVEWTWQVTAKAERGNKLVKTGQPNTKRFDTIK